jgi:DNA-binding MarR family transcriptional regulator
MAVRPRASHAADPVESVVDAVLRASRALVAVAARSLAAVDHDVTLPQYRALVVLASRGPQTPGELAGALEVHASTATRMCDRLVAKRLVHRGRRPSDRRTVELRLTARGRRLVDSVTARRRAEILRVVERVPMSQRRAMVRALHTFGAAAGEPGDAGWFLEEPPP